MANKRILEKPIPTYYGNEICYVNGMRYAKDVIKASLQASLQRVNLFYDRRFDCQPIIAGEKYPSKLEFDSTHSRVLDMVPAGARVLDLGSGNGSVGAALKEKGCYVVGCDIVRAPLTARFDQFVVANLEHGLPEIQSEQFDYILLLDVIEHLRSPEDFLDQLRVLGARTGAELILTTANIGFIITRLMLMVGRFEYGKRGILDLTHARLFTFATMRRALRAAGFDLIASEGVGMPLPLIVGLSPISRLMMRINQCLARMRPTLFGFQILLRAKARPNLDTLLGSARCAAETKRAEPPSRASCAA
jgi:2-polyprenyl-3-methyl-5-hydroxy-6-metoxy-1,4-benzoquinol methylase